MIHDVAVIGLGAMGSAAAHHLAQRGVSVLGLDRFAPPHAFGSSHGQTRIIREAYFEHPLYVPLVQRAYELWAQLEGESGRDLLRITGGLSIGRRDGVLVRGARASALAHRLPHEVLPAAAVRARYPALRPDDDMVGIWEPRAGVLYPEACIEAHLALARARGATLRFGETVRGWTATSVLTDQGEYPCRKILLAAGAWTGSLLRGLPLTVERQVLHWFAPSGDAALFTPDRCPVHLWETAPQQYFYGFPDLGTGVKVALHHGGETAEPDGLRREVAAGEVEAVRSLVRRFLPQADGALRSSAVCMYTNTPDEHFWIGRAPGEERVLVASACSGHGFKFASAMGEVLADLLTGAAPPFDLSLFAPR